MATQLKQTDFAPQAAPRHNIRVVFSAGPAALAMREKLVDVPGADQTLDELALQSKTRDLIQMARDHLSPALHDAFLRWCEASIMFNTETDNDTDDEIDAQASRHGDALHALEEAKAETISDMCLKSYVAMVEASERGGVIGPIDQANRERLGFAAINIGGGFANDILTLSPLTWLLNDIAAKAWSISRPSNNWLPTVGLPLVALFAEASTPAAVSLREWDKAYDVYQRATTAFRDCPEEPQDEFNRVTCASADATLQVMTTPAPTLNEFRIKVALLASTRADELGRDGEAIMAVAADARRLLPEPTVDADGAWATAKAEWDAVRQDMSTKGLSDEQVEVLVEREMTAFCGLTSLPLRNADDIATRLRAMIDVFDHVPPEPLTDLLADMMGLFATQRQANDGVILDAFADRRRQFVDTRDVVLTPEAENAYFARLDANDETLANTSAGTIAGVVAKLRVAFAQTNSDAWSDQAIGNPTGSAFREGLRLGNLYEQMMWSAIEDLARIGGVSLSEQGK